MLRKKPSEMFRLFAHKTAEQLLLLLPIFIINIIEGCIYVDCANERLV